MTRFKPAIPHELLGRRADLDCHVVQVQVFRYAQPVRCHVQAVREQAIDPKAMPATTWTTMLTAVNAIRSGFVSRTNTRMRDLVAVLHSESVTMSGLAASLDLPAPLATRAVDELVERGLLERSPDASDRRRALVRMTEAGRQVFFDIHQESGVVLGSVLEQMSDEQADACG